MTQDPTYGDGDALASPPLRSVFERMTNPTAQDLRATETLKTLGPAQVEQLVGYIITTLEHLAKQRPGMSVKTSRDDKGWSLRIEHGFGR